MRESTPMAMGQLSEVLDIVEVRGQLTGGFAVSGPWRSASPAGIPLKYVAILQGQPSCAASSSPNRWS